MSRGAPVLFGSYCGCSDSEVVWISRSATPLSLIAASTTVISLALASLAARAVLPWLETPSRITALSGTAAAVPSPVTVISFSTRSAVCAEAGASAAAKGKDADQDTRCRHRHLTIISPARTR